jgi:hypothetical protein
MDNKQRLKIHQDVFQKIHICNIACNHQKLTKIIDLIVAWSFASNGSNGEASEYEIRKKQDKILKMLEEI